VFGYKRQWLLHTRMGRHLQWCRGEIPLRYVQSVTSPSLTIESLSEDITDVVGGPDMDRVGWGVGWMADAGCGVVAGML
jgi:hypothetical protein